MTISITTQQQDVRTMRALHADIRDAARTLTEPGVRVIERDNGLRTEHTAASLLDQLAAATKHGSTRNGAGRGSASAPVAVEVVDLLRRIRAEAAALWQTYGEGDPTQIPRELTQRVRELTAGACLRVNLDDLTHVHRHVSDWITAIRGILDPPRRLHLVAACPACDVRIVHRTDPTTGERVRQPALCVDTDTGCTCLSCGEQWPTDHLEHLAQVIGCTPLSA